MNNSQFTIEEVLVEEDRKPDLRAKETELIAILRAISNLTVNPDWKLLQEIIFDGVLESLKRQRDVEVEKKPLNGPMIHFLNGQIAWAKKYSDIGSLANIYKLELTNVRNKLNANN